MLTPATLPIAPLSVYLFDPQGVQHPELRAAAEPDRVHC
jgi:hypothetical protein